ncbi:HAD family hydrolase [Pseudothermotoga sp.]
MKLLVFDLDGTLLERDGTLSVRTVELLKRLESIGIRSTIATGRSLKSAMGFVESLSITMPLILFNGARIFDPTNKNYLYSKFLPSRLIEKVVSDCRDRNVAIFFFIDEDVYALNVSLHATNYIFRDGLSYHLIENLTQLHTAKVTKLVFAGPSHELSGLELFIRSHHGQEMNVTRSEEDLLEVLPTGVSKAEAVKWLCAFLRIDLKEVAAFGNGENDAEMLRVAGFGVSFVSAPESVKKNAKILLQNCGYLGLKEFVEKFVEKVVF